MVAPNDTSSSTVQATPVSTRLEDIAWDDSDYANFKIQQKIGEYTVTCDRDLVPARVKYLYNEEALARGINVSYGLNQGYDAYMEDERDVYSIVYKRGQMDENDTNKADEKLDNFWKWIIMQAPKGSSVKEVLHDADIVCCRGLLRRIACTPYLWREAWEFSAIRFNNVVFLCEEERYTGWHESGNQVPQWYRGLKFKQHMTVTDLNEEPRTDELVTREELVMVFCSTLGPDHENPLKLVYNGSIDAIKPGGELVELKTRRCAQGYHFARDLKFYINSLFVGTADIYLGYHDDNGIATRVEHVPTCTFCLCEDGRPLFSVGECMQFLSDMLNSIRSALQNDGEACKVRHAKNDPKVTIYPASLAEVDFFKKTNFREHFNFL